VAHFLRLPDMKLTGLIGISVGGYKAAVGSDVSATNFSNQRQAATEMRRTTLSLHETLIYSMLL